MLVFDNEVLKICDFGMAKDVKYHGYYFRQSKVRTNILQDVLTLPLRNICHLAYVACKMDVSRVYDGQIIHRSERRVSNKNT